MRFSVGKFYFYCAHGGESKAQAKQAGTGGRGGAEGAHTYKHTRTHTQVNTRTDLWLTFNETHFARQTTQTNRQTDRQTHTHAHRVRIKQDRRDTGWCGAWDGWGRGTMDPGLPVRPGTFFLSSVPGQGETNLLMINRQNLASRDLDLCTRRSVSYPLCQGATTTNPVSQSSVFDPSMGQPMCFHSLKSRAETVSVFKRTSCIFAQKHVVCHVW